MKITAIQCPGCKDIIISRARHDYNTCSCGETAIDGGQQDYVSVSGNLLSGVKLLHIDLPVTLRELYNDWSEDINRWKILHEEDIRDKIITDTNII